MTTMNNRERISHPGPLGRLVIFFCVLIEEFHIRGLFEGLYNVQPLQRGPRCEIPHWGTVIMSRILKLLLSSPQQHVISIRTRNSPIWTSFDRWVPGPDWYFNIGRLWSGWGKPNQVGTLSVLYVFTSTNDKKVKRVAQRLDRNWHQR